MMKNYYVVTLIDGGVRKWLRAPRGRRVSWTNNVLRATRFPDDRMRAWNRAHRYDADAVRMTDGI